MTGGFPPIKYKNSKDNKKNIKLKKERFYANSNNININKLLVENKKKSIIDIIKNDTIDDIETIDKI